MAIDGRSAELLQMIADMIGVDAALFRSMQGLRAGNPIDDGPVEHPDAVLVFRLNRAFRALPDGARRLHALEYVEALAYQGRGES